MKLYIVHADAPSLTIVASHIAKVARRLGHEVLQKTYPDLVDLRMHKPDGILYVYPVNPPMSGRFAAFYSTQSLYLKQQQQLWYGTTEGTPWGEPARYPMWYYIRFVANSMYTATKLQELNYNVIDIVHHGYDPDEVKEALDYAPTLRKRLERDHPGKIYFAVVEGGHARKGWGNLLDAVAALPDNVKDRVLILAIAPPKIADEVAKRDLGNRVKIVGEFGKVVRRNVLALMAAADYVIVPSLAEGFGLPLLEANAVGRPAIFCRYQPLTEFADVDANITFPYDELREIVDNGVEFELHTYDVSYLTEAIAKAVEIYGTTEYDDRARRVQEAVKDLDINELYPRILRHFA